MTVGICHLTLRLPQNHSLKEKRRVLKSLAARVHNRFNVSVAEVEGNDRWQLAVLGISCVSNGSQHAQRVIAAVVDFIEKDRPDLEVVDCQVEIIHASGA